MSTLRASAVAEAAGVNRETLRYYERRGLLPEPLRSPGGHRLYPDDTVTTLRVIKAAQRLGFTLDEVGDLVDLGRHRHGVQPTRGFQAKISEKLEEIAARICDLETIRTTLEAAKAAGCDDLAACTAAEECPIPFTAIATAGENDSQH